MASADKFVLAVDVGNTTTRFGLFHDQTLVGTSELTTPSHLTADDARLMAAQALRLARKTEPADGDLATSATTDGAILSCVVPTLVDPWREALASVASERPLVVGPGLKTGMRLGVDDPSEVGPDRIADAVAARASKGAPVVVVDLGTTTHIEVVDATGNFVGGIIAPGLELGARSLSEAAARLPMIEVRAPRHVIGTNTRAAMQSGVVLGEVARIDGLLDATLEELGYEKAFPIVITGDHAASIAALLHHSTSVDETLTLRGLDLLWEFNRRA